MGVDPRTLPLRYRQQIDQQSRGQNHHHHSGLGSTEPEHGSAPSLESCAPGEVPSMGSSRQSHRVTVVMHRIGELDRDNKWSAPKALLDGLVAAELIPGDKESQIDYRVEQVRVHTRAEIKTVITVEEIES